MKREIQLYQNKWQPNFNFEKLDCDFDFYQINCEMKNKEFYQKFVKIGATFSEISNSYRGSYEEQSFVMTKKAPLIRKDWTHCVIFLRPSRYK